MIQRLQSVYLLGVTIICIVLVLVDLPYYQESGAVSADHSAIEITVDYNSTDTAVEQIGTNDGLIYFLVVSALLSFVTIFLYKKRKLQLKLVAVLLILIVALMVVMYVYSISKGYTTVDTKRSILMGALSPVSILLLAFLAHRGIKRDDKLVRSLDRIR